MGFMDKIFGSQEPKNKIQQLSTLTGGQREVLDMLTNILKGQVGQGIQPYPGQTVAPVSPLQQSVFNAAGQIAPAAGKAMDAYGSVMDYFDPALSSRMTGVSETALNDILKKFDPASTQKAFTEGVQAPTIKAWKEDTLPSILEHYAGKNAGNSGAINRAMVRGSTDLMSNLGATRAQNLLGAENNWESRRLAGVGQAANLSQVPAETMRTAGQAATLGTGMLGNQLGIGTQERAIGQESLTDLLSRYEQGQGYNNPWLKFMPTALGTTAFDTLVTPRLTQREENQNNMDIISQLIMGGLQLF